jgi:N-sulfoglucosamine sulfohydrolase
MIKKIVILVFLIMSLSSYAEKNKPNVVWIFVEDMNDWMGCYGDHTVPTPNIDKLAEGGMRFNRAYMTAGVCSASRSAIALGTMQTTLGVHNHRSSRQRIPEEVFNLPEHTQTVYQLLRNNGYHVINSGPKNDFNFLWPTQSQMELDKVKGKYGSGAYFTNNKSELLYDVNSKYWGFVPEIWKDRPEDKPVFIQFQLKGGKNTGRYKNAKINYTGKPMKTGKFNVYTDTSKIEVMPYYPDLPIVRKEIAHHYDCIRQTDDELGRIIETLKEEGLYDNSIIFFWTDHGMRLPRHKQWLYEGGIRVPLLVAGTGIDEGKVREDLISGIDITATTLALCGIDIPKWMEGRDMLAKDFERNYVVSARDRCDFTIERVRAITTKQFKYIRNFLTDRPFMQPQYRDGRAYVDDLRAYYESGKMNYTQAFIWSETRIPEELYDLENDPHETINLANDPTYADELNKHRKILENWIKASDDKGQYPETDTALRGALMQWSEKAVNPEYDKVR